MSSCTGLNHPMHICLLAASAITSPARSFFLAFFLSLVCPLTKNSVHHCIEINLVGSNDTLIT